MNNKLNVNFAEMSETELMQLRGEIDEALAKQSVQKVAEADGFSTRLERLGAYKANEKMLADAAEQKRLDEASGLVQQIQALKPRIDELLAVGNACLESGIPMDGSDQYGNEGYNTHQFFTNSWSHLVGFVGNGPNNAGGIEYLGINAGGACGKWNFRTNGVDIFEQSGTEVQGPQIGHMKRFVKEFDEFESAFYAYVDKMIEKQQKSVDAILADAQGRVVAPEGSGKSDVERALD